MGLSKFYFRTPIIWSSVPTPLRPKWDRGGIVKSRTKVCKIYPLSETVVFMGAGVRTLQTSGKVVLDTADIARTAYQLSSDHTVKQISEIWANLIQDRLNDYESIIFDKNFTNTINIHGIFGGLSNKFDYMTTESVEIKYSKADERFEYKFDLLTPPRPPTSGNYDFIYFSHAELAHRFIHGEVMKAMSHRADLPATDRDAAIVQSLVQAVIDGANDPSVGGEVAILILQRDKGLTWFHRPDVCLGYSPF